VDWVEFTTDDRVLLQAICHLWVRGQGKTQQVQELKRENATLKQKAGAPELLGSSAELEKLRERLRKVAATKATILINGETGSGKELVAQFIHDHSPRSGGPFVKMNCAAMPEGLVESELFGHAKGAFTDAKSSHAGRFSQANGGTLFLDEIGEMPLLVQSKVLRAIESGEIERVGDEGSMKVDTRIIAASHRNLAEMVEQGKFRQDLFYRLNVLTAAVPPLREHAEDIGVIAAHFLAAFCTENGMAQLSFSKEALARLQSYAWPGNVRELRNIVQRCAVEADGAVICLEAVRAQLG
jgi:transcriptional regulator with GAF, ATPase, and Fis domain